MSCERLAQLMQTQLHAMATDLEARATHETIVSIFRALDQGDITVGCAVYLLGYQAVYWPTTPPRLPFIARPQRSSGRYSERSSEEALAGTQDPIQSCGGLHFFTDSF